MTQKKNHSWYVLQTKPQNEDRVCQQFKRVCHPEGLRHPERSEGSPLRNVETFCPKIKCMSQTKGESVKYKPLFPNYVFINWNLTEPENHRLVKYTRGVNKVLGDGERPVPISDEIIEIIRGRVNEGGIIEQKTFKVGDEVKVKKGYLRDLVGILERPVSDSGRVAVLLNLFNRQMRVQMQCSEIGRA